MKRSALVITVAVLAAGAWWLMRASAEPAVTAPVVIGTERTWRLTLRAHAELPPLDPKAPSAPSDLLTTGVLRLRGYGASNGFEKVGLSLARLDEARMTVFGAPAMQDQAALREALTGGEAVLTVRREGDVEDIDFTPGSHNLFKSFAQTVVGELQLPLREGDQWTLLDTTLRGKAEATYTRTADGVERTRTRYVKLTAFGSGLSSVTVAAKAHFRRSATGLESLRSVESLEGVANDGTPVVSTLELELEPKTAEPLAAALPEKLEPSAPGELTRPADWREQMLAQRVNGLTPQELVDGLSVHGAGASPQSIARFLPRASGLLVQQPQLCAVVAERASNARTPVAERVFALEVLAAAGSPEAQAAMRDILDSDTFRADPDRVERFQRLSLLQRPTAETVDFVGATWARGTPGDRRTLSLVLGATAGMLARAGDETHATPWVSRLTEALHGASDAEDRKSLVGALGNVGLTSAVPDVLSALRDPDARVRTEAVHALRKTPVPEARRAVTLALEDAVLPVQAGAVEVLLRWKPDSAERAALVGGLRGGRLPLSLGHQVVSALEPFTVEPEVRSMLQWLASQPAADPSLQRRARALAGEAL